jgi:hypothetical protein
MSGKFVRSSILLLAIVALTSCGGEGSPAAGPPVAVTPPPPSPPPPPPPPPSPTYGLAHDFTANRQFPAFGVRVVRTATGFVPGSITAVAPPSFKADISEETLAAGFDFTASPRSYTARWFDDSVIAPTQEQKFQDQTFDQYRGTLDSFIRIQPNPRLAQVGSTFWDKSIFQVQGNFGFPNSTRDHFGVFGFRTQSSDQPISGSASYTGYPRMNLYHPVEIPIGSGFTFTGQSADLNVNWTTRVVTVTLKFNYSPSPPPNIVTEFVISGSLPSSTARIAGAVTGGGYQGQALGAVYGPRANQIGLVFFAQHPDGRVMAGNVVGFSAVTP